MNWAADGQFYRDGAFLGQPLAQLLLRVVFGLSYDLQAEITTTVLETMKTFLQTNRRKTGYAEDCLSLSVDFLQQRFLDVAVLVDFKGDQAPAYRRIERALTKWCVELPATPTTGKSPSLYGASALRWQGIVWSTLWNRY